MDNNTNTVNNTNVNQINPECLGSVLVNGVYYDKKTAKFLSLKESEFPPINVTNDNETFYAKFLNLFKSK
jgi:hypothetical protein